MIYDTLLQLPVFQGMSHQQLIDLVEKVPFGFSKYHTGETVCALGEQNDRVFFLLQGTVRVVQTSCEDRVLIEQDFTGPHTLPFYYLFGRQTQSHCSITAVGEVGIMELGKRYFLEVLQLSEIPLVNVLNILSSHAQRQHDILDMAVIRDPVPALASWLLLRTDRNAHNVCITATENDWCDILHLSLSEYRLAAATLEGRRCIELSGQRLKLIDRYALSNFVSVK